MTAAILSGHRLIRPHGMAGGEPGQPGHNWVLRSDGTVQELGPYDRTEMDPGDVFVVETPGAGVGGSRVEDGARLTFVYNPGGTDG